MKTIRVVAAIIVEDGKVFATQRGYGEFKDGWEFPGGKIEAGESPQEALRRESLEDLDGEACRQCRMGLSGLSSFDGLLRLPHSER